MSRTTIALVFMVSLLACGPAFSLEDCDLSLEIQFTPASIVLGSKLEMNISILNNSQESKLVPIDRQIPSFLDVTFEPGSRATMLRKPSGILKTQELKPNQEITVSVGAVYGPFFCEPGEYQVTAKLADEVAETLGPSLQCAQGFAAVVIKEPTGRDKQAFETAVSNLEPSRFTCVEATVYAHFQANSGLVDEFPTAIYTGFYLADQLSLLPGVGNDPQEKVQLLSDPSFFLRFPTTHNRSSAHPDSASLDMKTEVEAAAKIRREFIEAHPDFTLREEIEKQLGELELVLGNYDRAYSAWKWISENTSDDSGWAEGMVQAMEVQELVEPDAQTDQ